MQHESTRNDVPRYPRTKDDIIAEHSHVFSESGNMAVATSIFVMFRFWRALRPQGYKRSEGAGRPLSVWKQVSKVNIHLLPLKLIEK